MKKKKVILPVAVVVVVAVIGIVRGIAGGESGKGTGADRETESNADWDADRDTGRDVLEETSPFSGYEQILAALEDSIVPEPDLSGDVTGDLAGSVTGNSTGDSGADTGDASGVLQPGLDELISNWILENTSVEAVSEDSKVCVVKVSYPDVASLMEELSAGVEVSYEGQDAESFFDQVGAENDRIQRQVLERLQNGEVRRVEETIEVEINEKDHSLIWNEELVNAMSGGLYRMLMQSGE